MRFVAKGFTQIYEVDYFEIFSPMAHWNFVRVILSLAVNLDWNLHQLDVNNAFLYDELDEEVHIDQPLGYVVHGEERKVCGLQ